MVSSDAHRFRSQAAEVAGRTCIGRRSQLWLSSRRFASNSFPLIWRARASAPGTRRGRRSSCGRGGVDSCGCRTVGARRRLRRWWKARQILRSPLPVADSCGAVRSDHGAGERGGLRPVLRSRLSAPTGRSAGLSNRPLNHPRPAAARTTARLERLAKSLRGGNERRTRRRTTPACREERRWRCRVSGRGLGGRHAALRRWAMTIRRNGSTDDHPTRHRRPPAQTSAPPMYTTARPPSDSHHRVRERGRRGAYPGGGDAMDSQTPAAALRAGERTSGRRHRPNNVVFGSDPMRD
jgi:hypothetical protein